MANNKILRAGLATTLALGSSVVAPFGAFAESEQPFCIEDGECYSTLQAAFDAVPSDGTLTTVYLDGTDSIVYDGGGAFYTNGKGTHPANANYNVVFDLKGKTYIISNAPVGSTGYETQSFHLEKGGKITFKDGTIAASSDSGVKMLLQNYADTILDNVTLDASTNSNISYAASNNFGSLTVTGNSNIIASDGGVAFDLWYGMSTIYFDGVSVSFDEDFTGKVIGTVEYGRSNTAKDVTDWQDKTQLSIAGGNFDIALANGSSDALTGANINITGGTFSSEPGYVAEGYKAIKTDDGYVVSPLITEMTLGTGEESVDLYSNENQAMAISYTPEAALVDFEVTVDNPELFYEAPKIEYSNDVPGLLFTAAETGTGEATITVTEKNSGVTASVVVNVTEAINGGYAGLEDGTTTFVTFEEPVAGENLAIEISNEGMTEDEMAKISPFLKAVYDISLVNQDTEDVISVSDNNVGVTLILNAADYEGMNYFKVVYIDEDGNLAEAFDTEAFASEDSDYIVLNFTTTHFSTYGVLASATEFPSVLTPDTGAMTVEESGSTYDYSGLIASVAALMIAAVVAKIATRKSNRVRE